MEKNEANGGGKKSRLCLDEEGGKFLGVCAGIAKFLDVKVWAVRATLIVTILFGVWIVVPLYFVLWLLMDRSKAGELKRTINNNPTVIHLKNVDYKKRLYRNSRKGKFLGVCAGIADYLEVRVFWVRVITIGVIIFSGFFALLAYFAAYFVLNDRPGKPEYLKKNSEYNKYKETLDETQHSPRSTMSSCAKRYSALQERLVRLEAYVTSSRFRLNAAFKDLDSSS